MFEIGLSSGKISEELFGNYLKAGIKHMEVSMPYNFYPEIDYKSLKKWSQDYDVNLWSFHLPFSPFTQIEISKKELCKATIEYYTELVAKASDIGIDKFIVHPSGEPIDDSERYDRKERSKESLFELSEIANKNGAVVAVENLPRSCIGKNSDEIHELVSVHEKLRVCFDTNHLLSEDMCRFVRKINDKIVTMHVSDYDFTDEQHWLPGEGKTDWQALVSVLEEIGYKGIWLYEVPFENTAKIQRSRDLVCEDFVRNAKEIFENTPITIIR